jgi:hypothetical protein
MDFHQHTQRPICGKHWMALRKHCSKCEWSFIKIMSSIDNSDLDMDGMDTIKEGYIPPRVEDDSWGKISMSPHKDFIVGSYVALKFTFTTGIKGVAPGGIIRVGTPCTGWGKPLLPHTRYWYSGQIASYIRTNTSIELITSGKASITPFIEAKMLRYAPPGGMWRWWISARVEGDYLQPGDTIHMNYGFEDQEDTKVQVQKFIEREAYFIGLVDAAGDGNYVEIADSPFKFDVIKGSAQRIHATLPSRMQKGQSERARIALLDEYWNPAAPPFSGEISIGSQDPAEGFDTHIDLSQVTEPHILSPGISFSHLGRAEIQVETTSPLKRMSNPVEVIEDPIDEQIYWGDLHAQSKYHGPGASSVGMPDELYRYAREITHLDFLAITDDVAPLSEGWKELQEAAISHYAPGKFVTFKAFEWCSKRYGHRNTIFADVEVEDNYSRQLFDGTIEDFWDFFREKKVLIIPHHTFLWTNWDFYDSDLEPVVEIHSCWGTSEYPGNPGWDHSIKPGGGVQAALGRGYRLGIMASSDTCAGLPGRSVANAERWNFHKEKGGLTAVYAPELTREAIFEALYRRRSYATTGARIILDFSLNHYPMGSEYILLGDSPINIRIKALGTDLIKTVTIVRNNIDLKTFEIRDDAAEISYQDDQDLISETFKDDQGQLFVFYYIRLTQYDGEIAWSSPIWVKFVR